MRRILPLVQLNSSERTLHFGRLHTTEYVELYANNDSDERQTVDVTFGGQTYYVRVRNVVAAPAYGDVLCDGEGDVGVYISSRGCPTYGSTDLIVTNGATTSPELYPGDVVGVAHDDTVRYTVVTQSGTTVKFDTPLPDGTYTDWFKKSRHDGGDYREGGGTLSSNMDLVTCSVCHTLFAGDMVVADVGGQHSLIHVVGVVDEYAFTVATAVPLEGVKWWHVPMTIEVHVAPLAMRRIDAGVTLHIRDTNVFGDTTVSINHQNYATCAGAPIACTYRPEHRMRITLRPRAQQTRLVPGVPIDGESNIITCSASSTAVGVAGHSFPPASVSIPTIIR